MSKIRFIMAKKTIDLFLITLLTVTTCHCVKYETPTNCLWNEESGKFAVSCNIRTIENRTLISSLQGEGTFKLRLLCNPEVYYESVLLPGQFQKLSQLEELELEHCKVTQLQDGVFNGLKDLKKLTIRTEIANWSPVRQLELYSFNGLKELQFLDLSYNNIRDINRFLFCDLSNLNTLNLSYNALNELDPSLFGATSELPDESYEVTPQPCHVDVITLDLSYNNLTDLPSFISSPKRRRLQYLNVQNNRLTALRASSLAGLVALRVVNASYNRLVDLPAVPLRETCRELREVHLRDNSLHDLGDVFTRLEQLLVLDVARNQLVNLGTSLSGLIRLIVLDLAKNALNRVEALAFKDLYSLQILDLRDNAIASIADDAFLPLYNLHTLNLAGNRLTEIGASTLNGLFVLNKLTLSLNLITEVAPSSFRNCSDLKELDLSGNVLTEVPFALTELPFLRTLDLGENRISGFRNGSFRNLHQLTGLRLIDNSIGNVTADMLWDLTGLQVLNLAKNKIQNVERGSFDRSERLEAVRLDANYLTDVNGVFTALPSLVWLNLSDNHLVWFDFAFVPPSLHWLDIHSNFIEKLGNYYEITDGFHLRTIDVSQNKLTELTPLSIPNSVEIFFASNNKIKSITTGTFKDKQNLTRVDLYANNLEHVDLVSLKVIDRQPEFFLGGNPFRCDCTMEWLQRVNTSVMLGTHVMDLDDITCKNSQSARSSNFLCNYENHCSNHCNCCETDNCDCQIKCPFNCTCYHDQAWSINAIDCSVSNHIIVPGNIPVDATEMYMDGNNIKKLHNNAFIGLNNLVVLYVNNSKIETIQNNTFNSLSSLELLYLHENKLSLLNGYEFEGLSFLRELYLQNNRLIHINNSTFSPLTSLQLLRLDGNSLTSFSIWELNRQNQDISELFLANNPWNCRCKFSVELRRWLKDSGGQIPDFGARVCLRSHTETEICEYEPDEIFNINTYLPLLIIASLLLLLLITILVIIIRNRDSIKLWLFTKYNLRLFCKTVVNEDRDKLYDAYICYSPKDEEQLVQYLTLGLESGYPRYSLCLHYRDLPADVRDVAVVDAGEASRRVILVVTRSFLQTEWARRDFRAALNESLRDKGFKVIVVEEHGGLPPELERDPDLKPYLKSGRRIKWGDKKFWERLKYLMPETRQYRQNINFTIDSSGASQTNGTFPGKRKLNNHPLFNLDHQENTETQQQGCTLPKKQPNNHQVANNHREAVSPEEVVPPRLPNGYSLQRVHSPANSAHSTVSRVQRLDSPVSPPQLYNHANSSQLYSPDPEHLYSSINEDYSSWQRRTPSAARGYAPPPVPTMLPDLHQGRAYLV